ncbi:MCP methyltransferase, CheR-type [Desulfuromusa kysingii]|uniref:protein-glutamate O-methyltransferase n=1 Tax=Desulfuromusa kysingii TaxID=37625 RepID=A0A1H4CPK4_9BACT|nr:protein-glutamate O-methyltransferase CheR [Desulfuromusa kysingii]SEA62263.1 MCP methyltransferase, CheR-type [Desulfuromusa kysingii]
MTLSTGQQHQNNSLMAISDLEFTRLRDLIYQRFGINLTEQKRSLLVGRLQKLMRRLNLPSFSAYFEYLDQDKTEAGLSELVDLISTNHTYFNREKDHFDYFSETALPAVIERLKKQHRKDLRIWCAGCSSGEEPYTLLMLMMEYLGADYSSWDAGILATDISDRALTVARRGTYAMDRVMQLPEQLRRKYFIPAGQGEMAVCDKVKKEATFRRFNLMNTTFPFKKPFQMIFCRNVMIYFDQPTREALVSRYHQHTEPGGYLFIGHSETLGRTQTRYNYLKPALYQKGEL